MGCDGGSIPKRRELVKDRKADARVDKEALRRAEWLHCALSKDPLRAPIVACKLGQLYNKDSILLFLLDKESFGEARALCGHIRRMKDVFALNLTANAELAERQREGAPNAAEAQVDQPAPFVCPITMKPMNGQYRFVFLRRCGHAFTEQAARELKSTTCFVCNATYAKEDLVLLNPTREEKAVMLADATAAGASRRERQEKTKDKKRGAEEGEDSAAAAAPVVKVKRMAGPSAPRDAAAAAASAAAREEPSAPLPRIIAAAKQSGAIQSLYRKETGLAPSAKENFITMGTYSRF